jgi:amino acid transporter
MYILVFSAAWHLRRTQPNRYRPFRVPGGWFGITFVCLLGLVLSILVFAAGFIRPSGLHEIDEGRYLITIIVGMAISLAPPLCLIVYQRLCKEHQPT